ncbi:pyridoxamine 5'-phosphate oxidase family protein [Microbacterium sp. 179-I 3D4 NHS]|uniref:pyridoxamine 5'-phosphate oxidase family protein n=1 Tax=Microbacterium sp. 179-I 3D4 NHS TaxID=3142381 RepID=UPI0039A1ED75
MASGESLGAGDGRSTALSESECWTLLAIPGLARLAFLQADGMPDIRPVNHLAYDRSLYLRTAPDAKLLALADAPDVALEIDGEDGTGYWSVIVRGTAAQVTSEAELQRAAVAALESWTPGLKQFVVRISPRTVTGRRFLKMPPRTPPVYAVPLTDAAQADHETHRGDRPQPIPHFSPPED